LIWLASLVVQAAKKEFWDSEDPAGWSNDEKQILLGQSPWARESFVRMEVEKKRQKTPGYNSNGRQGPDMPETRTGIPQGGLKSVPIGGEVPPVPNPDPGHPVQFRVLARWESAKPVRLAGSPEVPDLTGQFYVIRLHGLPLMPAPKAKPGEVPPDPNEGILQAIKEGSRLERKGKTGIPCDHLFKGPGNTAMDVLLFFPRITDPITVADKLVTLESQFGVFHLSVRFPLKEMTYKVELAL